MFLNPQTKFFLMAAQRPFVPYEQFDVERFSDYGKMGYDKHENDDSHGMRGMKKTK
jgi:hypothetical protein